MQNGTKFSFDNKLTVKLFEIQYFFVSLRLEL